MPQTIRWLEVKSTIEQLSKLPGLNLQACAAMLKARFIRQGPRRYRAESPEEPFQSMEIGVDDDQRVCFVLFEVVDLEGELAAEVKRLGPPVDMDIVSPPLSGEGGKPPWLRKYSVCHRMNGKKVRFGIEEYDRGERLVSIRLAFAGTSGR